MIRSLFDVPSPFWTDSGNKEPPSAKATEGGIFQDSSGKWDFVIADQAAVHRGLTTYTP
jgi:hypothetical protein